MKHAHRKAKKVRTWQAVVLLCALTGVMATGACKGGSDLTGRAVTVTADFLPDNAMPGSGTVSFRKGTVVSSRVIIEVVVTDVTEPVSGIVLKLTYPNQFSKFVKCIDGDLLPPGNCLFAEPGVGSGEVFIGRSITNPEPAVPVSDSQVIVQIEFLVFGAGSDNIIIEAQNLGGGDASALLDENGNPILVQWSSGQIMGM